MKKVYIKPQLEVFDYTTEEGFAQTIALEKDYLLIEGNDGSTMRTSEEVTEWTDNSGEFETGLWE